MKFVIIGLVVFAILVVILRQLRSRRDPMIVSIVMMRSRPRSLTERDVRAAVWRALKHEAELKVLDGPLPDSKVYLVVVPEVPPLMIVDSGRPYMSPADLERSVASFEDPRAREGLVTHKAWVSVDAHSGGVHIPKDGRAKIYNMLLGKIAAELLDDDCTLLYLPAEGRIGMPGEGVAAQLANAKVGEVFGDDDLQEPIVSVEAGDSRVNAAMEVARKRLPELVAALGKHPGKCEAIVKGTFRDDAGGVEYMWVKVASLDPKGFVGEVLNRPGLKGLPGRGASVTVLTEDVVDWLYTDEAGQAHGGFVERVLRGK